MPTNRINVSLIGENIVPDLIQLRKNLENMTGKRLSLSDVLKAVLVTRVSDKRLAELINS
jgi:hypothetical protein